MKRIVTLMMVAVVCFGFASLGNAADWKMAHLRPAGTEIDKDLTVFADAVREGTNNEIDIKIYGNSQLGDYTVVQERVGLGSVEMSCQSVATQVDKKLLIGTLQYIVFDYPSAQKMFSTGGPLSTYIAKLYAKQGIKVLGWWPMYFGGIGLTKEPANPTDPTAKQNLKIRVPTMKTFEVLADKLGYQATPLPFAEVFTAAQTGMVDGVLGGGAENYYSTLRDLVKYYVPANTHFEVWPLLVNLELYEDLSDKERAVIDKAAADFETRRWAKAEADQAKYEKLLAEAGVTVYPLSSEDLKKFADVAKEHVFPEFKKIVGDAAYEEIFTALEQK